MSDSPCRGRRSERGAPLRTIKKETETFALPPDHHRRPARGSLPKGPGYLPHKCIGPPAHLSKHRAALPWGLLSAGLESRPHAHSRSHPCPNSFPWLCVFVSFYLFIVSLFSFLLIVMVTLWMCVDFLTTSLQFTYALLPTVLAKAAGAWGAGGRRKIRPDHLDHPDHLGRCIHFEC